MSDARPPGLLRKIAHTFATQAFGQGSSIAAGIVTAHAFGPAGKGLLALATILVTFGVTTADGVRNAVAFQIGPQQRDARVVWGTALRLMAAIAPLGVALFAVLWHFSSESVAFLFAAVTFPFALYIQSVGVLYQLRDHVEKINVQNSLTIGGGISLVTLVLVAVFHAPVSAVLGATTVAYAAACLWAGAAFRR